MGEKTSEDEAVGFILSVLKMAGRPLTTREVQEEADRRLVRCPDSTPVFLNKLRMNGLIKGEYSRERKAWIWWVEGIETASI